MVMVDDETVVLFGDMNEALEYIELLVQAAASPMAAANYEILHHGREKCNVRTQSGEEIFVIDGHTHNWDGGQDNRRIFTASSSSNASTPIIRAQPEGSRTGRRKNSINTARSDVSGSVRRWL